MRRRATETHPGDESDSFILNGEKSAGDKLRQTSSFCRSSTLKNFFGAVVLLAVIVAIAGSSKNNETSTNSLKEAADNVTKNNGQPSESNNIHLYPSTKNGHSVEKPPLPTRKPQIPRRLIFTYKYNLIDPSNEDPPFNAKDPLTANVLKTIHIYTKFWEIMDERPRLGYSKNHNPEKPQVAFLSDGDCIKAIEQSEPRLLPHFQTEKRGEFKADICRVATLFLEGGYYFDIDISVVAPIDFNKLPIPGDRPLITQFQALKGLTVARFPRSTEQNPQTDKIDDSFATFATIFNKAGRYFQAFTAAMPGHPVLRKGLDFMLGLYEENLESLIPPSVLDKKMKAFPDGFPTRKKLAGMGLGPFTLKLAYDATTEDEWEEFATKVRERHGIFNAISSQDTVPSKKYARFLYELSLEDKLVTESGIFNKIPLQDSDNKWCNFVCVEGSRVYFYSRVKGSKGCPLEGKN